MKSVLAVILATFMAFSCQPAYADDFNWHDALETEIRIAFLGWSKHFGKPAITNESHEILAVEYMGWSAGKFDNSYGRETWFVAKNWRWKNFFGVEHVNALASLGINKGYRTCYGDDDSNSNICAHGYIGLEYDRHWLVHSLKVQPGVVLYHPEIKFSW